MLQGCWTIVGGGTPEHGGCCCVVDCTTGSCCDTGICPTDGTDCVEPAIGVEKTELGVGVSIRGADAVPFCKYVTAAVVSPKIFVQLNIQI